MRTILISMLAAVGCLAAEPLRICVTTSDLGDLARRLGGDRVAVTVFVKGTEDPHVLQARPSLIRELNRADLFVQVGLELEAGWVPAVIKGARNPRILPHTPGFLDASTAIQPKFDTAGPVDRSAGHVHSLGNPHYLLDPVCGLRVAALIRQRLGALRPADDAAFEANWQALRNALAVALVGDYLAGKYEIEKLMALDDQGKLAEFLARTGETGKLGGWLGELAPCAGARIVTDHELWRYFADRFKLQVVDHLEPKPGVTPTTSHLAQVVRRIEQEQIRVILAASYFAPRHAAFVAERTGATVLPMAHQVGARPEAGDYLAMVGGNVRLLAHALR